MFADAKHFAAGGAIFAKDSFVIIAHARSKNRLSSGNGFPNPFGTAGDHGDLILKHSGFPFLCIPKFCKPCRFFLFAKLILPFCSVS